MKDKRQQSGPAARFGRCVPPKMKKTILYILLILASCTLKQSDTSEKLFSFSEDLQYYISSSQVIADSIKNGSVQHTFADGAQVAFTTNNGQIDSVFQVTYPSGRLKAMVHFANGSFGLASHAEYYDDEIDYLVRNETDTLEVTEPKIHRFYFTNHKGRIIYQRYYNVKGEPEKTEGHLIALTRIIDKLQFTTGEPIQIQYYVVPEPYPMDNDLRRELTIKIYHQDSLIKDYDSAIATDCSCVVIDETFTTSGAYQFEAIARYEDIPGTGQDYSALSMMTDTANVDIQIEEAKLSNL